MMLISIALMAADPAPLSLEPFMDEQTAAVALERQLDCLGREAFARQSDRRPTKDVAADVVKACTKQSSDLRNALADVYTRKPNLIAPRKTPIDAANLFVAEMNNRAVLVIEEGRHHR